MATWDNVDLELTQRGQWLIISADNERRGQPFWLEYGYRTIGEQWGFWNDWVRALVKVGCTNPRNPTIHQRKAAQATGVPLAAYPGTSDHGKDPALAIDIGCDYVDRGLRTRLAIRAGLEQKVPGEEWHLTLRRGRGPLPSLPVQQSAPVITNEISKVKTMFEGKDVTDACTDPRTGGQWRVSWDGGVSNTNGAPLYGSYGMLDEKDRNIPRNFNAIAPFRDGYIIVATTGEDYFFNPQTAEEFRRKNRL